MDNFVHTYLLHPSVYLTLKASLLALALQLLVGLPLGLFLAGKKNMSRLICEIIFTLPMIFPPMALGFFLLLMLGKNSLIGQFLYNSFQLKIIFSFWGVLIATFIVGLPFMIKSVQAARRQMNQSLVEAAQTLGKSNFQILYRVILPNIKSGVMAGLLLAYGRSIGEVGITLMLGGNIIGRTETLSLAIYNAVFEGDIQRAAIFSALLSLIAIVILIISNLIQLDGSKLRPSRFSLHKKND